MQHYSKHNKKKVKKNKVVMRDDDEAEQLHHAPPNKDKKSGGKKRAREQKEMVMGVVEEGEGGDMIAADSYNEEGEMEEEEEEEEDPAALERKRKKKEKFKALKAAKRAKLGATPGLLPQQLGPELQASFLQEATASLLPPLSLVEKQQQGGGLSSDHIVQVVASSERTPANLPAFLKAALPHLTTLNCDKTQRVKGSPFCLILSSSAVRANELAKALRQQLHHLKTAKLFGKHIKVEVQQQALEGEAFHALAVGTPARVKKLLQLGPLSLAATRLVVLDMALDTKKFHLLNLPGVAVETADLLRSFVVPQLGTGRFKIALF